MRLIKKIDQKQLIEDNLDSLDIFRYYIGNSFVIGKPFNSVLRKDQNPSCSIYLDKTGKNYRYKDFADSTNLSAIGYVQELYNLTFSQALDKICADFNLLNIDFKAEIVKKEYNKEEIVKKKKIIQFIPKQFSEQDLEFWDSFGVSHIETLKKFDIYSISKLFLNKQEYILKRNESVFSFFFPVSNNSKIYFPFRNKKEGRFISNTSNDCDVMGHWQANPKENKPNLLILTKSMKEVCFFYERGISAISLHGENHLPNKDYIRHLRKYCKNIISMLDKDDAGIKGMENLKELFNIEFITFPDFKCEDKIIKDLTDAYKFCNKQEVLQFIQEIKEKYDNNRESNKI